VPLELLIASNCCQSASKLYKSKTKGDIRMSLKDKLEERYKASSERIPPEAAQVMVESQQELDQSGIADKTLKVDNKDRHNKRIWLLNLIFWRNS